MAVPTYDLYGEPHQETPEHWLHCETIVSRSSLNRWEIRLHRHQRFQQFLYIRSGECDATIGEEQLKVTAPCVLSIPPGVKHGFRFSSDIDGIVVTLVADRPWLTPLTEHAYGQQDPWLIPLGEDADSRYLAETIQRLLGIFQSDGARSMLAQAYVSCIVHLLPRLGNNGRSAANEAGATEQVLALERLIDLHFRSHMTVAEYADRLKISAGHLNRLMRSHTGSGVHALITRRLMTEAQRLLIFSPSNIQTISEQLGFSDSAYFCRWFRKLAATSPNEYRQQMLRDMS